METPAFTLPALKTISTLLSFSFARGPISLSRIRHFIPCSVCVFVILHRTQDGATALELCWDANKRVALAVCLLYDPVLVGLTMDYLSCVQTIAAESVVVETTSTN